ncbi:MAG: HD domain-containing protein [Minisyncoccia bacterium]|jgi:guanosine-3',5'-bis(diphosphate) 3'-pyrophosphohydrolase
MNRAEFFARISDRPTVELARVQLAYWLAKNAHRPFFRDGGERYFEHPRAVALSLVDHGYRETDDIVRALLHDIIEDTNTPCAVIVDLFGPKMWRELETLSRYVPSFDPVTGQTIGRFKKSLDEYYGPIMVASDGVKKTKCADRCHNLKTCGVWEAPRRDRYLGETEERVLPVARTLVGSYATELEAMIAEIRAGSLLS